MRVILQRVSEAAVTVEKQEIAKIRSGYLALLGVSPNDTETDLDWILKKLASLKLFEGADGRMSLNLSETEYELLVVSQFTLYASTKKGNRPSFHRSAPPKQAEALYELFLEKAVLQFPSRVQSGEFGAEMQVSLINDGPVTIFLDSENPE